MHTTDLPFRAVLTPQANAKLVSGDANFSMKLENARPKVLATFFDLRICKPLKLPPALCCRVPRAGTQAFVIRKSLGRILEQLVGGTDLGVPCF